jgi:hypothetical protein
MERRLFKLPDFKIVFKAWWAHDKIFCEDLDRKWLRENDFIKARF